MPEIPKTLLEVKEEPAIPAAEGSTQKDVALYLVDLHGAYYECTGNLNAVRDLIEKFAQEKEE